MKEAKEEDEGGAGRWEQEAAEEKRDANNKAKAVVDKAGRAKRASGVKADARQRYLQNEDYQSGDGVNGAAGAGCVVGVVMVFLHYVCLAGCRRPRNRVARAEQHVPTPGIVGAVAAVSYEQELDRALDALMAGMERAPW